MKKHYKHLSVEERDLLAVLKGKGHGIRDVARILKRSPSSIYRELKRNAPPIRTGYYLAHWIVESREGSDFLGCSSVWKPFWSLGNWVSRIHWKTAKSFIFPAILDGAGKYLDMNFRVAFQYRCSG